MHCLRWRAAVIAALAGLVATAFAADGRPPFKKNIHQRRALQEVKDIRRVPVDDGRGVVFSVPVPATVGQFQSAGVTSSPGIAICAEGTVYDYQQNDDGQKQIATLGNGYLVHFAWTHWAICPDSIGQCGREVRYAAYSTAAGVLPGDCGLTVSGGGGNPAVTRAGYSTLDAGSDGRAHPAFHQYDPEDFGGGASPPETLKYMTWVLDQGPDVSLFSESVTPGSKDAEAIWPHIAIDKGGSTTRAPGDDVFHVCSTPQGDLPGVGGDIFYWRRIGTGGLWEGPAVLDHQDLSINHHVATDPTSERVSVVYNIDDPATSLLQVAYLESNTDGADWITQGVPIFPSPVEPFVGGRNIITNYAAAVGPQAWLECAGEYDSDGRLHIVWIEQANANVGAECRLQHWDNVSGAIRTITEALDFVNTGGSGGRDLWLASPQIAFGDGSTSCTDGPSNPGSGGATSNRNYVYVSYEQYGGRTDAEGQDVSDIPGTDYQNLEIYLTASNDHGATWSPQLNLTNTKSPGCDDTPGNLCASERDPSIALLVNDTIHLFYVLDYNAGDAVFGQGTWSNTPNPVMYYRIPGGTDTEPVCPALGPSFAAYLSDVDPDCEYHAPQNPPSTVIEELTIRNLGNAVLTGDVSISPASATWLQMVTGTYTIGPGDPDDIRTVTMQTGYPWTEVEGLYQAQIVITHNDPTQVSPKIIPVDLFVIDSFYCSEYATLHTDSLWLKVGSTGRYAKLSETAGGLSRLVSDSSWSVYDASLVIGGPPNPDTLVWRNIYGSGNGQPGFRALGNLILDTSAYGTNAGSARAYATMVTADSAIGIDVTYTFPQHPDSSEFVLVDYHLTNRTGFALTGLQIGDAVDFDVIPSPSLGDVQTDRQNTGHLWPDYNLIYQQGVDTIGHIVTGDATATRFKAGITSIQCNAVPRAWIAPNDPWLYNRDGGGFSEGYLYQEMTKTGYELFPPNDPDPGEDLHSVIVLAQDYTLPSYAIADFTVGLVSSNVGNDDPAELINTTKKAWRYAFGWKRIVGLSIVPENTAATLFYYASGSHEGGLAGGCCGCEVTKVSGAPELTIVGGEPGGCEGSIMFSGGDKCAAPYVAVFRVQDLCGDYADDYVVSIDIDGVCSDTCDCPHQGDMDWPVDPFVTALDLAFLIDHLFAGGGCEQDPDCPTVRCDFDADCFSTALDLSKLIDYLFAGGPGPTDPCTAGPDGRPITCGDAAW